MKTPSGETAPNPGVLPFRAATEAIWAAFVFIMRAFGNSSPASPWIGEVSEAHPKIWSDSMRTTALDNRIKSVPDWRTNLRFLGKYVNPQRKRALALSGLI